MRTIIAFLIAPIAAPVLLLPVLYSPLVGLNPAFTHIALMIGGGLAYAGMIVLGIPAYFVFTAMGWTRARLAMITGAVSGAVAQQALQIGFALRTGESVRDIAKATIAGFTDPATSAMQFFWLGLAAILGLAVGIAFWLIARPDRATARA